MGLEQQCVPQSMHHGQTTPQIVFVEPQPKHLERLNASLRLP